MKLEAWPVGSDVTWRTGGEVWRDGACWGARVSGGGGYVAWLVVGSQI